MNKLAFIAAGTLVAGLASAQVLLSDGFETGLGGWTIGAGDPFFQDIFSSSSGAASAGLVGLPTVNTSTMDSGVMVNTGIAGGVSMTFMHNRNFETNFDGGQLYVNINNGGWTLVAETDMTGDVYNSTISTAWSSPIGGQRAWSNNSQGWLAVTANLTAIGAGDSFQVRFLAAHDSSVNNAGNDWNIDDVVVRATPVPEPATMTILGLGALAAAARRRRK